MIEDVIEEAISDLEAARVEATRLHSEAQYGSGLQCRYAGQLDAYGKSIEVLRALQVRELRKSKLGSSQDR